jgi:large subunit ribosomal protein L25
MHEKAPSLQVYPRNRLGSRYASRDRAKGLLPGILYGHKQDPVPVNFNAKETIEHIKAGEKVFRLDFPGEKNKDEMQLVLLKDLQFDYLGSAIIHADFSRVDLDERVKTRVHIDLAGDAKGLKSAGAILIHPTSEIMIECKVRDLPETITVDISHLEMGQSITADKVKLPAADMKLLTDSHAIVAQIVEQKEIVVAEATTVAGEAPAGPEVIGEKERAEKAAAAAAADGKAPAKGAAAPAKDAKAAAPKK